MDYYWLYTLLAFVLSAISGFIVMPYIVRFCLKRKLYDLPNERKVHHHAIPRLGGIAFIPCMFFAFLVSLYIFACMNDNAPVGISMWTCSFVVSLFMIYLVGLIDDVIGLGAKLKFVVQIVAASLLPACGLYINNFYEFMGISEVPFWIGAPLTVFVIVFIDNAINLIDGIDGLSGGLSLISLIGFLICFGREGIWTYCVLIAGLMGVLIAYLYFNIFGSPERHTKLFMGDSGSLTLGFILGFLMVKFAMDNNSVMPYRRDSLLLSYTLLIVPCFDVVRVVMARLRSHQPLFKADKRHLHHKLLRCGLTQHQTLCVILLMQVAFVVTNILAYNYMDFTWIVLINISTFTLLNLIMDVVIRRKESSMQEQKA